MIAVAQARSGGKRLQDREGGKTVSSSLYLLHSEFNASLNLSQRQQDFVRQSLMEQKPLWDCDHRGMNTESLARPTQQAVDESPRITPAPFKGKKGCRDPAHQFS